MNLDGKMWLHQVLGWEVTSWWVEWVGVGVQAEFCQTTSMTGVAVSYVAYHQCVFWGNENWQQQKSANLVDISCVTESLHKQEKLDIMFFILVCHKDVSNMLLHPF